MFDYFNYLCIVYDLKFIKIIFKTIPTAIIGYITKQKLISSCTSLIFTLLIPRYIKYNTSFYKNSSFRSVNIKLCITIHIMINSVYCITEVFKLYVEAPRGVRELAKGAASKHRKPKLMYLGHV